MLQPTRQRSSTRLRLMELLQKDTQVSVCEGKCLSQRVSATHAEASLG